MELKEKCLAIINHYDVLPQLKYFQSEIYELTEAIIMYEDAKYNSYEKYSSDEIDGLKDHIAEEIADVQLMLNQFKGYYSISDYQIKKIMSFKADRQLDRIKNEDSKEY